MSDKKRGEIENKVWHLVMEHLKELKLSAATFYNDYAKLAKKVYQKCQVDMLAESVRDFKEWKYRCENENSMPIFSDDQAWVSEEAWQACTSKYKAEIEAKDKRIKELEACVLELVSHYKITDYFMFNSQSVIKSMSQRGC